MQRVVGEMYWLILTDTFLRTEDKQKRYTVLSFAQTYSLRLRLSQQENERNEIKFLFNTEFELVIVPQIEIPIVYMTMKSILFIHDEILSKRIFLGM